MRRISSQRTRTGPVQLNPTISEFQSTSKHAAQYVTYPQYNDIIISKCNIYMQYHEVVLRLRAFLFCFETSWFRRFLVVVTTITSKSSVELKSTICTFLKSFYKLLTIDTD